MRALGVGVLVVAALFAIGCKGNDSAQVGALPPPPSLPAVDAGTVAPPSVGAPRGIAAANRALERLAPDRRFVLAFEQVDRIFDGASTTHAVARRKPDGTWSIETSDKGGAAATAVAQLPDDADFEPLMDAVAAYAARHAQPAATAKSSPPPLTAESVEIPVGHKAFAALAAADDAWKSPSQRPFAARRAASALVGIFFGTSDRLEMVDELPARAIAASAVARALGARPLPSVEALLARTLGYGTAAIRLAPETANDAAAAYAAWDDARLVRIAKSSPFGKLAWLRRIALEDDFPARRAWTERELSREQTTTPVLAIQTMGHAQLENDAALAAQFPPLALAEALDASGDLARDSGPAHERVKAVLASKAASFDAAAAALGTSRTDILVAYDKALAALPSRGGPFRDGGLERDYLDTNMVAAMTAVKQYYAGTLGSPSAAADWANGLAEPAAARTKEFRTFFLATVAGLSTGKPTDAAAHVTAASLLGGSGRYMILANIAGHLEPADATKVGRGLLARLDSRPAHRNIAAWVSKQLIKNERAVETFYRSTAAVAGGAQASVAVDVLRRDRDPDSIVRFARWSAPAARERARLVSWAITEKVGDRGVLDSIADDLMRDRPLDWNIQSSFVSAYDASDPARARAIAQGWLDRKAGAANGGLGDVGARIALARYLRREHKYEEAIGALAPAAATWQGGALGALALTHAEAGHFADAEKLAVRRLERYPQSVEAVVDLARVRWMSKDMAGAATGLASAPKPLTDAEIRYYLAPVFGELFSDKTDQAVAAAEALRAAKLLRVSDYCAAALLQRKSYVAALLLMQPQSTPRVAVSGTTDDPRRVTANMRMLTFEAILGAKGKDEAAKWLRGEVGKNPQTFYAVVYEAFDHDKLEVVLDVDPPVAHQPDDPASDWTMRLAAQLRRDGRVSTADDARKAFAKLPNARYSLYGRYLLGDIDADTVEKLASSQQKTCELAYYMAVRAMGDGRHADAVDLLRVAADTSSTHDAEYVWALDDLDYYATVTRAFAALPPGLPRREVKQDP